MHTGEPTRIEDLENVPHEIAEALRNAGYKTVKALTIATPRDLVEDVMISVQKAEEIIEKAISSISEPPMTAEDLFREEQERGKLTTGSTNLDTLLEGGIWEREITEISGGFSTGKTQLCFQLSVNAQLSKDHGGLDGKVFFIDTEGTFSPKRVGEIAIGSNLNPQEVLKGIFYSRALDSGQQMRVVKTVSDMIEEKNIKLLIVDSIASHFRTDFIRRDQMIERQQKIMQHASSLANLAYLHDVAVVVTNQIVARVENLSSMADAQPALGHAWAHRPQTRILMQQSPGQARKARLIDSPRSPSGEGIFYITKNGITDYPKKN